MRPRDSLIAEWTIAGAILGGILTSVGAMQSEMRGMTAWLLLTTGGAGGGALLGYIGCRIFGGR